MNWKTLRDLPKAELHRHLDGSIRLQTVADIVARYDLDLGVSNKEELIRKARISEPMKDLQAVIDSFATIRQVLCSYETIERIAFENVEDAYRDGIHLLELRFAPPFISLGKELGNDEIIEAVLDGVTRGMNRYPIQVGLIGILVRTVDLEINRRATADLIRYAGGSHRNADRICGFDLADAEDRSDPQDFLPMVQEARQAGLGITIHSGENTTAAAVQQTLDLFNPARIGHGIRSWGDDELLERIRKQSVMLEVCPTSNWLTSSVASLEEHPLPHLYRAGIPVSINSDDPNLFGIDLVNEYEICRELYGFNEEDFLRINRQTVEHSFLPREIRTDVLSKHFPSRR
ncbi:MAG: adenosine deaminase [Spirochaetaceae bacterium]|nr:MAG: adenosine deaminase [Spirochaetaceae bacterium]